MLMKRPIEFPNLTIFRFLAFMDPAGWNSYAWQTDRIFRELLLDISTGSSMKPYSHAQC